MAKLNEQQIKEIAGRLADKYSEYWYQGEEERRPWVEKACKDLYERFSRIKRVKRELFVSAIEAEIKQLEAEIDRSQTKYIEREKDRPLTEMYIQYETGEVKWRDVPPYGATMKDWVTFNNRVKIDFLRAVFLKGLANEPPAFNEDELYSVVKAALESTKNLNSAGNFHSTEKKSEYILRALFKAIRPTCLKGVTSVTIMFSDFLERRFAAKISEKSLRTPPTKAENIEKERDLEARFSAVIEEIQGK